MLLQILNTDIFRQIYTKLRDSGIKKSTDLQISNKIQLVNIYAMINIGFLSLYIAIYISVGWLDVAFFFSLPLFSKILIFYFNHRGAYLEAKFILMISSNYCILVALSVFGIESGMLFYYILLLFQSNILFDRSEALYRYLFFLTIATGLFFLEFINYDLFSKNITNTRLLHLIHFSNFLMTSTLLFLTHHFYFKSIRIPDNLFRDQIKLRKFLEKEIYERQIAEESRVKSEKLHDEIIHLIPSFILILGKDGSIRKKNTKREDSLTLMYSDFENLDQGFPYLLNLPALFNHHDMNVYEFEKNLRSILSGKSKYYEVNFDQMDGSGNKFCFSIKIYPIRYESENGAIIFHTDTTLMKKQKEKLEKITEINEILKKSQDVIINLNSEGTILDVYLSTECSSLFMKLNSIGSNLWSLDLPEAFLEESKKTIERVKNTKNTYSFTMPLHCHNQKNDLYTVKIQSITDSEQLISMRKN